MCRNIRTLYNFEPPATEQEVRDAALQFVRKVSGYRAPNATNQAAFDQAVEEISATTARLLETLVTRTPSKNREAERERARERNRKRFGDSA